MSQAPFTLRPWRRVEYERLVEQGIFEGGPLELVGGHRIVAEPKGPITPPRSVRSATWRRRACLLDGSSAFRMRSLSTTTRSPSPDVAVVAGTYEDYLEAHPERPVLVIEVADSSLLFDRHQKGSAYARAGRLDYWIVNLVDRVVEVYREPIPDPSARHE